ncbi:acyl CoA:acetate/3-ketoacid CoA transferase [Bradyrhizobium vignae]|uniref:acyl CoA:acetate/3-ketoacid CoA transferase n=1 Tax=Bradyrhizobium vignae TaxID=1549949 RepID=UPI00100AB6F6|nr:CoA-transferase [Bradyrhizobium vignae]RXG93235.1 acyl CoA:acetate/3-ketoacid CoA transferase [Bradyrhizobium vignae]
MKQKIITASEAAKLVGDGDVVCIGASAGLNCPDFVLAAIGERFRSEGHPRDLTVFSPIAAGDMYGIKGIDHLAQKGLLSTILAGSYPSGPSSLPSPAIWEMIGRNDVAAYNLPSGVMYDMARDVAAKRAGVLTKVGLDTFVDPRLDGCKMNEAAVKRGEIVRLVEFGGEPWLHFPNHAPQVAIIRGTTADERGNISMEHEGAVLGMVDLALAARNSGGIVICQVKRTTASGSIPTHRVHVPSTLVDYIVVDPEQAQATEISYDPAISGETRRPLSSFEPEPWSVEKVIARRAAMELTDDSAVNLGFGISAMVPQILVEEGHAEAVTWAIEQGAVGGVPLTGFAFGCAANAQAIFPTPQQFTYFQGGGFDSSFLSFLEVDAFGNVNVSRLAARPYLTAGCGGFVDITANARKIVFSGYFMAGGLKVSAGEGRLRIQQEGKIAKFIPEVSHVTFSGRRAVDRGCEVTYVTERCVLALRPSGLTVVEIAPGVDLERDIIARAGTPLIVADDLKLMDERLFRPERFGLKLHDRTGTKPLSKQRAA